MPSADSDWVKSTPIKLGGLNYKIRLGWVRAILDGPGPVQSLRVNVESFPLGILATLLSLLITQPWLAKVSTRLKIFLTTAQ